MLFVFIADIVVEPSAALDELIDAPTDGDDDVFAEVKKGDAGPLHCLPDEPDEETENRGEGREKSADDTTAARAAFGSNALGIGNAAAGDTDGA